MSMPATPFERVLECSLQQLLVLQSEFNEGSFEKGYCQVLIRYLQCDVEGLAAQTESLKLKKAENPTQNLLAVVSELRLAVRRLKVDPALAERVIAASQQPGIAPEWLGEAYFVLAMASDVLFDDRQSLFWNKKAREIWNACGIQRKSLLAAQNAVAAMSRIDPTKNLLLDYYDVYRIARKQGAREIAGVALLNLAREYQIMGALESGLKACNRALACLAPEIGTLQYYLALMNRCHLLIDLGRKDEALLDYEAATLAPFAEVQSGLKTLQYLLGLTQELPTQSGSFVATWAERSKALAQDDVTGPRLSVQEDQLTRILSEGEFTSSVVIGKIFGETVQMEQAQNRLKSLLHRIERKRPGLIVKTRGKLRLSDQIAHEKRSA